MGRKHFCIFPANLWKNQESATRPVPGRSGLRGAAKEASNSCDRREETRPPPRVGLWIQPEQHGIHLHPRPPQSSSCQHQENEPQTAHHSGPPTPPAAFWGIKVLKSALHKFIQAMA